jgi:hypothetical protein
MEGFLFTSALDSDMAYYQIELDHDADAQKLCTILFPLHMGKYKYKRLLMSIKIAWLLMCFKTSCRSSSKIWNMLRQLSYLDDLLIQTNISFEYHLLKLEMVLAKLSTSRRKDFLDYIDDSMSHDSLIGSTISTRSKKSVSCVSKISSSSVLSHDSKASKVSEKDKPHDFYPKNFNHAFLPKPEFEGYRNNAKKEFEENRINHLGEEEFHQEPDLPSTFMKMVKERTRTMSAVNDERRQVLPSKVIWDGTNHQPF